MKDHYDSSGTCFKFTIFLTFIVVITTFGTCSLLQWKEIIKLTDRVAKLELDRLVNVNKRSQDATIVVSSEDEKLHKKLYEQLLVDITEKQLAMLKNYCVGSSKICLPGPRGEKGERGRDGKRGPKGEPGDSLSGARRYRDLYTEGHDVADTCCNHLAKPILLGPTDIALTSNRGTDIILPCRPTGLPPAEVHWSPAVDPKQLGRYIQTVDGILIKTTDFVDSTTFTCHASNVFGSVDKTIHLIVKEPIQVTVTPLTSQLNSNQSIDLTCTFTGVPPPVVKWYHKKPNNQMEAITSGITTTSQQSVLHLSGVNALSAGEYMCNVFNNYDNSSSSANLAVTSKPAIILGPQTQLVNVGTTVTLRCDVVSNPPASIAWTFPKTGNIPPKTATLNPDGSVTLFHVDSFSEGQYTCTATNALGSTTSTGTLNVNMPLTVIAAPHDKGLTSADTFVQLTCHVSGGGQATLKWSKLNSPSLMANPGKFLTVGDGLIITGVDQTADSGVYICSGSNGRDQASDKVLLYKDMGQLTCTTTFSDCSALLGGACGGTCPPGCTGGNIYGYQRYTTTSLVCLAAAHTGGLNNKAVWTVEHSTNTFEPKMSNGIQSQFSGPVAQEAVFWNPQQATSTPVFG